MSAKEEIRSRVGEKFGEWTLRGVSDGVNSGGNVVAVCQCSCGTVVNVSWSTLRLGKSRKCRRCSAKKHGLHKHPLYGDKGIYVCDEWQEFLPFYQWAVKNGWKPGLAIDRRKNKEGYSPGNCRFVTDDINMQNTSLRMIRRNRQ